MCHLRGIAKMLKLLDTLQLNFQPETLDPDFER